MTNVDVPSPAADRRLWLWRFVAGAAWLAAVAFSLHFLAAVYGKYHQPSPDAYTMFWDRRGWLYAHLAGGAVTILLGPVQLMMRQVITSRRVHRWTGRAYLLGMLVACTGAVGLISTSPAPPEIRAAFTGTMSVWIVTVAFAMHAIRQRRVRVHRRWMIRNYLVTLAPVAFRLLLSLAIAVGIAPSPRVIAALLTASWLLPLTAYEILGRLPQRGNARVLRPLDNVPDAA